MNVAIGTQFELTSVQYKRLVDMNPGEYARIGFKNETGGENIIGLFQKLQEWGKFRSGNCFYFLLYIGSMYSHQGCWMCNLTDRKITIKKVIYTW